MQLALVVVGAIFVLVAGLVTIQRLRRSPRQSAARKAMWGNLGQLVATAIFIALAALATHSANALLRWGPVVAASFTAINVVVTLAIYKRRAEASA
ncbi:hypothetical protein [Mycobacterium simiae]|uniref:hypothetical protein n=1 Tax=Mycobacterium simiae TaxID=1784 RepID=UPI0005CAA6FB|nr:hypothetical protein [Mycobacterium simiae]PLV44935.1 hypothetical protein X011_25600 [Mycobacterium tuberculosis variant microti OV254]BBX38915.1 hypothetical protein MSIM_03660 [Mycobacterium simiae]